MPGRDGTGPVGNYGCRKVNGCRGAGLRLRDGTGCKRVYAAPDDRKEILKSHRKILESRIKEIDKLLGEN